MIIDTHIHVGQFCDQYFSPVFVHQLTEQLQIGSYAVSSTTMCEENYPKVIDELHELIELDSDKVLPVMWITPEGLKGHIAWFLESEIKWRCIKVHPFLHKNDWAPDGGQFMEVLEIARELKVPLLIHTGDDVSCQAEKYDSLIENNPDINFILAHGRPIHQVIPILKHYFNVYADSAFMPIKEMKQILEEGLSEKLLWGTDMCIPQYFDPDKNMVDYYNSKLNFFREICSQEQFNSVTCKNASNLFHINELAS